MSEFSIQQVNALHKAGKYNDASSMCIEMIKAGQDVVILREKLRREERVCQENDC